MSSSVQFTQAAADKVYQLMKEVDNFDLKFRAYITGGGCSGFKYGFTFDEEVNDDDFVFTRDVTDDATGETVEVTLLIGAQSYHYLSQATIDYQRDLQGEQFVIHNPNAKTTCGCGSSFSVDG